MVRYDLDGHLAECSWLASFVQAAAVASTAGGILRGRKTTLSSTNFCAILMRSRMIQPVPHSSVQNGAPLEGFRVQDAQERV